MWKDREHEKSGYFRPPLVYSERRTSLHMYKKMNFCLYCVFESILLIGVHDVYEYKTAFLVKVFNYHFKHSTGSPYYAWK